MLTGMIVLYDSRPMVVTAMQGPVPAWAGQKVDTRYTLVPPVWAGATKLVSLINPKADQIPLLPRCDTCGIGAEPGSYGSAGWRCNPACSTGTPARVPS